MKKLLLIVLGVLGLAATARAVSIEGYSPSGAFQAVAVTEDGRLTVEISTGAVQHVIVDTGTISATVTPVVFPLLGHNCSTVGSGSHLILAADTRRKGALLCNEDLTANAWFGDLTTTNANTPTTPPGSCFNPDMGTLPIYTGNLYAYTTSTIRLCWYYKWQP